MRPSGYRHSDLRQLEEMLAEAEDEVAYLKNCIHQIWASQAYYILRPIFIKLDLLDE